MEEGKERSWASPLTGRRHPVVHLCEEQQREVNVSGWALSSAMPSDALYGGGAVLVGIEIRHVVTPR